MRSSGAVNSRWQKASFPGRAGVRVGPQPLTQKLIISSCLRLRKKGELLITMVFSHGMEIADETENDDEA